MAPVPSAAMVDDARFLLPQGRSFRLPVDGETLHTGTHVFYKRDKIAHAYELERHDPYGPHAHADASHEPAPARHAREGAAAPGGRSRWQSMPKDLLVSGALMAAVAAAALRGRR